MKPRDSDVHALSEALRESNALLADLINVLRDDEPRKMLRRRVRANRALLAKQPDRTEEAGQ